MSGRTALYAAALEEAADARAERAAGAVLGGARQQGQQVK